MRHVWLSLQLLGMACVIVGVGGLFGWFWAAIVGGVVAAVIGEVKS